MTPTPRRRYRLDFAVTIYVDTHGDQIVEITPDAGNVTRTTCADWEHVTDAVTDIVRQTRIRTAA